MKLEIIFYPFHTHPIGWCEYHIKGFKILTYNETGCNILSISFKFDAPGEQNLELLKKGNFEISSLLDSRWTWWTCECDGC